MCIQFKTSHYICHIATELNNYTPVHIYYTKHIFNIIASNSVNTYDMLGIYCLLTWLFYQLHPSKHAWSELNSGRNIIIIFIPNCCTSRHNIIDEYDNGARLQWRDSHIVNCISKSTIVFHGPKKVFGAAILGVNRKVYRKLMNPPAYRLIVRWNIPSKIQ